MSKAQLYNFNSRKPEKDTIARLAEGAHPSHTILDKINERKEPPVLIYIKITKSQSKIKKAILNFTQCHS